MPLPPPPAKRAALMSLEGLDAPERQASKTQKPAYKPAGADKNNHPEAFLDVKKVSSPMKTGASSYKKESDLKVSPPSYKPDRKSVV